MVHKALKDCVIVTAGTGEHDWTNQMLSNWIKEASGSFERTLTDSTTHFVPTKKLWDMAGPLVTDAIQRRQNGQNIKIVSQDWLNESLQDKSKKKEKLYKLPMPGSNGKEDAGPRSHGGLLKELYLENTELTPTQKRLNEQKQAMEEALKKERAAEKEKEFQKHIQASMTMPELASIFKKGAQKAKKILLNDCYHIYQDTTGFYYDVTVTKVDTARNTNERYNLVLQIFESNVEPHSYATSTSFSGTKLPQIDNVVIAIGANFPTAMRAFRNCFKEKTGIEWADRIKVANERAIREQDMKKAKKMGMQVSRPAGPKSIEEFRLQKFQYYPPSYGPIGEIDTPPPQHQAANEPQNQEQDFLMSGGNGAKSKTSTAGATASRSATPVHAELGPEDLEKFIEAQVVENEDGEKLEPLAAPFDFGETVLEEESSGQATVAVEQDEQQQQLEEQQQAYASPPPEPDDTVLGKRKDSPVDEPEGGAKKQNTSPVFDPETGEYIIDEAAEDE